jgi:threonine/homoserine/homoserine lactone efflux protein
MEMGLLELIGIIELIIGVIINVFIGKLGEVIFRRDNKTSRIILRVIGVFLIINGVSRAFHV